MDDVPPGILGDEGGDLLGIVPDHDVLRHDRPREAAVSDRVDHVGHRLRALVEVGALHPLAAVAASLGPGGSERVAAGAALGEDLGTCMGGIVVGDLDALGPATRCRRERADGDQ